MSIITGLVKKISFMTGTDNTLSVFIYVYELFLYLLVMFNFTQNAKNNPTFWKYEKFDIHFSLKIHEV